MSLEDRQPRRGIRTRQQDLGEARRLVDEVLEESPRNAEALALRGTLLLNDGDAVGAIADFRTVLRDEPNRVPVVRLLARAHQTNDEPDLARDALQQGIEANPDATVLALDLANFYATREELDKALATLDTRPPSRPSSVVSNANERPDATLPSSAVTRSISSMLTLVVRKSEKPPTARLMPSTVPMNPRIGMAQMKRRTVR